jgi:hypothetical protein
LLERLKRLLEFGSKVEDVGSKVEDVVRIWVNLFKG